MWTPNVKTTHDLSFHHSCLCLYFSICSNVYVVTDNTYIYILHIWDISYIQIALSIFVLDLCLHMSLQLVFQHPTPMSDMAAFWLQLRHKRGQKTSETEAALKTWKRTWNIIEPKQWRWMVQIIFFFSTYELLFFSGELVVSVSKETTIL